MRDFFQKQNMLLNQNKDLVYISATYISATHAYQYYVTVKIWPLTSSVLVHFSERFLGFWDN